MTDVAAQEPAVAPAASETPAVETPVVETPVVETPVIETSVIEEHKGPLTKAEALKKMKEGLAAKRAAQEPAAPAELPKEEKPTAEEPVAETPPETVVEPVSEPAAEPVPEVAPEQSLKAETPRYVIDIDPNHPIAGTVKGPLILSDEASARAVKALLNGTYARRKDVEVAQENEQKWHEKYLELQTRLDVEKEWRGSESYQQKVEKYNRLMALEEAGELDKGTAQEYWNAGQPEVDQKIHQKLNEAREQLRNEAADRAQRQWTEDAWRRTGSVAEPVRTLPQFRTHFEEAVDLFNVKIGKGHYPNIQPGDAEGLHREFTKFLASQLIAKPDVSAALQNIKNGQQDKSKAAAEAAAAAERERARIKQEAIDEYRKKLAEERGANPPNPIANLGKVSTDRAVASSNGDKDLSELSALQARKQSRERALERARSFRR